MSNPKRQQELIEQLSNICAELGWVVALPENVDMVPGLIIGDEVFVNEVVQAYYGDAFEVFTRDQMEDNMKEVPKLPHGKKVGPTFH